MRDRGLPSGCSGSAYSRREWPSAIAVWFALSLMPASAAAAGMLAGCPMFPADNVWNVPVDNLPVDTASSAYVATIGAANQAHADFGTVYAGAPNGIPFLVVDGSQP